jgi:hypothetical protein
MDFRNVKKLICFALLALTTTTVRAAEPDYASENYCGLTAKTI